MRNWSIFSHHGYTSLVLRVSPRFTYYHSRTKHLKFLASLPPSAENSSHVFHSFRTFLRIYWMGQQTQGITSKPSESSCEDARVAALRCAFCCELVFLSSFQFVTNTLRFITHFYIGSTKYPDQRIVCKELYETYKECRKKEQEDIVKERKRKKVSILQ